MSVLISRIHEVRSRARQQGWRQVFALVRQSLRDRVIKPWHLIYWVPTAEARLLPLPTGTAFTVVSDPASELTAQQQRALHTALGIGSDRQAEERLAAGALLHVLFVGDDVAGTLFTVPGTARSFQHIVLTDRDSMVLDARIVPAFRGRGFYNILLSHVANALHARGQDRLYIDTAATNAPSLKAYEKVGFRFLTRYRMSWRRRYHFDEAAL